MCINLCKSKWSSIQVSDHSKLVVVSFYMRIKIGTVNVQTLYCNGSKEEKEARLGLIVVEMKKYNIDIMCICESHLTGYLDGDISDSDSNIYKIYCFGIEGQASAGVAFVLSPKVQSYCLANAVKYHHFNADDALGGRVMSLLVADTTIVLIYAPHKGNERENFMHQLGHNFTKTLSSYKKGPLIVTGDFNETLAQPEKGRNHVIPQCTRMGLELWEKDNLTSRSHFFYQGKNKAINDGSYKLRVPTGLPTDHKNIHCLTWELGVFNPQLNITLTKESEQLLKKIAGDPSRSKVTERMAELKKNTKGCGKINEYDDKV